MYGKIIPVIKKYDEALNQADFTQLSLFLQLAAEGVTFCLFNTTGNKFLSLEVVEFDNLINIDRIDTLVRQVLHEHIVLNPDVHSVYILYENNVSSLIPVPLFDENELSDFSGFSFADKLNHRLMFEKIVTLESYHLFQVPKTLQAIANELFPRNKSFSHSRIFIESLMNIHKNADSHRRVFVNVRKSNVDIAVLDGNKLQYYNIFQYKSKEDLIYFILFVMDQLNLNPEKTELKLSGTIDKNSKVFEMVHKYVRNLSFQDRSSTLSYSYIFGAVPSHYYFNLFNLPLCGL